MRKLRVSLDSGFGSGASRGSGINSRFRPSMDSGIDETYDFLFPNGIMVSIPCDRRSTLSEIKPLVWEKALQKPGAKFLRDAEKYVFIGRTREDTEQQFDDKMRISELHLVSPVLEVSEPIHSRDMKELCEKTGKAVGVPIQIIDHMETKDTELFQFRDELMSMGRDIATQRENWDISDKLNFFFPGEMDLNKELALCTEQKLRKGDNPMMDMKVWHVEEGTNNQYNIKFQATYTPRDIVQAAVAARCDRKGHDAKTKTFRIQAAGDIYVLKVATKEDYMLHDKCVHYYEYVRDCINRNEIPQLQIVTKDSLVYQLPNNKCMILKQGLPPKQTELDRRTRTSDVKLSWDISHDINYCIKVRTQPGRKDTCLFMEAQIFNGDQPISKVLKTQKCGYNTTWDFKVPIQCLPRTARLCFITFAVQKKLKNSKPRCINWVNMQIFDHTGMMRIGNQRMYVYDFPESVDVRVYPHGTPGSNWDNTAHTLEFDILSPCSQPISYPSNEYVDSIINRERRYYSTQEEKSLSSRLSALANKDPLYKMTEGEQRFLWHNRTVALDYAPKLLPKVIRTVKWTERHHVFELHQLLSNPNMCKITSLATALQLLGPWCQDEKARTLAVDWLKNNLDATSIELYLLQLVQIIKFESYLNNDFVKFILEKALLNVRIGHKFFWLMRSEMSDPASRARFAVILEAYCLFCGSAILDSRLREVKCLDVFKTISANVKKDSNTQGFKDRKEDRILAEILEERPSLMHPSTMVGKLLEEECRVMSSKMKPIMMSFATHRDLTAENGKIKYILKNGDDLRQDMLVVQLLRMMDMLWKYSSKDLKTTVYDCLAMDSDIGLIEVVQDSRTICEIERDTNTGPTGYTSLYQWLYEKTKDTIRFPVARDNFTHSCAGFCVSSFVLGIADRHSDNIMLSEKGQLFNIDFGHFMNHTKTKAGIRRERTPFILTKDFVNVITNNSTIKKNDPVFLEFLSIATEAYMTVRKHSDLILTLLSLMAPANLPELKDTKDINYCRECLGVDKDDHEALAYFCEQLFKSYKGQWATKINWFVHKVVNAMKSS